MAHNIAVINGAVQFAYSGATPWHSLGNRVPSMRSSADAIAAGGLNWTVRREPVYLADGRIVPDRYALIRETDDAPILGTAGPDFRPIQNSDAFGVLDAACTDHGCTIETIGALGNGARTFALLKLPEVITPIAGDDIRGYFVVVNGHDGSTAYGARPTPIRIVCQNTLNAALRSGVDSIRIRHTVSADARIKQAETLVSRLVASLKETGDTFRTLAEKRLTPDQIIRYVETVFPVPAGTDSAKPSDTIVSRRATVANLVFTGKGADLAGANATHGTATAWGVYNAVTEYFDHVRPAEAKSDSAKLSANTAAIFGNGNLTKLLALKAARELVAA